mgnify:CR=1 FL=1
MLVRIPYRHDKWARVTAGLTTVAKEVKERKIRTGTWNISTLTGRLRKVVEVMERRGIDNLCGGGVIVSNNWNKKLIKVKRVNNMLLKIPIIIGDMIVHIILAYAPQMGCQ